MMSAYSSSETSRVELSMAGIKKTKSDGERKALNVSPEAHDLATKLAVLRGLTVLELFDEEEVRDFFTHLLMDAIDREKKRREGKR